MIKLGNKKSVFQQKWPRYDPKALEQKLITVVLQVNGKVRARIQVSADISDEDLKEKALAEERIRSYSQKGIKKVVVVPGKIVNVVV